MIKSNVSRIILMGSALLLPFNASPFPNSSTNHKSPPIEVIIKEQPESKLSTAVADFLSFFTDGFRSVFKPLFVVSDKAKHHLDEGEHAKALQSTVIKGLIIAIPPLMSIVLLGGAKIAIKLIKRDLLNPEPAILNKTQNPYYGHIARLKQWYSGKNIQKMVFNQDSEGRLSGIIKKTFITKQLIKNGKKRTYTNLLLYGVPGTGKTLFAQTLARSTNMNFLPVTAASLLQKGVEGIKYFDELIEIANRSSYGTIIFIDEADGLFVDRNLLNPSSDHYKILEHILSVIDGRSNKFMIVAATNRAHVLDPAMHRRFQEQIEMPLPDKLACKKILEMYIQHILFNEKETSEKLIRYARALFTDEKIDAMAEMIQGLSHAEIADMIAALRNEAELNNHIIHDIHIEKILKEFVKKQNYQ